MSQKTYAVGDTVTLKTDLFRSGDAGRDCRIVAILPADHGEVQYRIRISTETHERRVVASDIDAPQGAAGEPAKTTAPKRLQGEPWLKPASIRVRK